MGTPLRRYKEEPPLFECVRLLCLLIFSFSLTFLGWLMAWEGGVCVWRHRGEHPRDDRLPAERRFSFTLCVPFPPHRSLLPAISISCWQSFFSPSHSHPSLSDAVISSSCAHLYEDESGGPEFAGVKVSEVMIRRRVLRCVFGVCFRAIFLHSFSFVRWMPTSE